jgi:hypothetical protein
VLNIDLGTAQLSHAVEEMVAGPPLAACRRGQQTNISNMITDGKHFGTDGNLLTLGSTLHDFSWV